MLRVVKRLGKKLLNWIFLVANMQFDTVDLLLGRDFLGSHEFMIKSKPWTVYLGNEIIQVCDNVD